VRPEHDAWRPAEHNGTFRGNNHAFVTARMALEKFWSNEVFSQQIAERAEIVSVRLHELAALVPGSRVKGRGMMQGLSVGSGELADRICRGCFQNGLIIETAGAYDEVVKVLAALTIPLDELEQGLDILGAAVKRAMATPSVPLTPSVPGTNSSATLFG
jgi:diaminobutyrate-2-oxoglutarate transaminase